MKKLLFALFLGVLTVSCSGDSAVQLQLEAAAKLINSQAPMQVDEMTRIDGAEVLSGKKLQYNYTTNLPEGVDMTMFKDEMNKNLVQMVKTEKDLEELRKAEVTFIFFYKDQKGKEILKVEVKPADYKK